MPKREQLPDHYHMTIAEINRRFYPIHITRDEQGEYRYLAEYRWDFGDEHSVPPAVGSRHRTGIVSFPRYQGALDFCHREYEESDIRVMGWRLAAACEVYPERNAWYIAEIEALAHAKLCVWRYFFDVTVSVSLDDDTSYTIVSRNIDDALVLLYERLCAHIQENISLPVAI